MAGRVSLGEHNIVPNYFEQNQAEALDLELTVMETLVRSAPDAQVRARCVFFLGGGGAWCGRRGVCWGEWVLLGV
jgi:hypothetical protein